MLLAVMLCFSCKEEKKVQTVRKVQKVEVPKGPRVMGDNTVSRKVGWVGGIYTVEVKRHADKTLSASCGRMALSFSVVSLQKLTSKPRSMNSIIARVRFWV